MKRWNGPGAVRCGIVLMGAVVLAGCTRRAVVSQESTGAAAAPAQSGSQELTETTLPASAAAPAAGALDVREIKVIEDNGQQGLFVKLSAPPAGVTHYVLDQPTRLVIDIVGTDGIAAETSQEYAVKNPVISEVGVGRVDGKLRLTVALRGDSAPTYTVNDLNDTVVAFLGEPSGGTQPVREQLVFTRRVVETAEREAPPPVARRAPAPQMARPSPAGAEPRGNSERVTVSEAGAASDTPATHKGYYGQHVSLDFKDADVHNVLRLLAEVSKLNIVATDDVRGKVTLRLFDVPWDQAFDIVLQVLSLESTQEGNVLRISTVRRLREEREELRKAQEAARAVEPLHVDYIKVNYAKAIKLGEIMSGTGLNAVRSRVGGSVENGVLTARGSVFVDEFTNTLIVRDIQKGIDNARELVRRLDVQTPEVLIESNIVEATTDFSRDLGIQWGYRYLAGPATGNPTGFNFPGTIGFGGSGVGAGANGVPFLANFPAAVDPTGGSALDLALGSINGSQTLDVRLTALEKEGKARIISRPRVVTLNNVAATIKSLTILRVKLPSTGTVINTGAGGAAGAASTATEKIETGIILVVTPQVSSDGYVLLDMYAKSSQADFTVTVDQIPTEIAREANSHILVKNGQTVVLGGIYRDNASVNQAGIPFLRDIPGIRWLFQSVSRRDRREDLLVFLTPRIMGGQQGSLPTAEELWKSQDSAPDSAKEG
jgi:type IV pilus secretin PilQ/predicted competence protein